MPAVLLMGCLLKRSTKFKKQNVPSKSFFIYIGFNSCWSFANGSLNTDLFFSDNVHLVEKGNLKLAESIFNSIENCNGVTCNKHKKFLISYKMAVSFKLNNFDFPPLSFLLYLSQFPLFLFRYCLLLHVVLPVMLVLFLINLCPILPTSVMVVFVQVMYLLVNLFVPVNLCVLTVSVQVSLLFPKNSDLSKSVCPRKINSSRSIRSSNVCQSRSNISPSKPVHPSKPVRRPVCKPVCPSNVTPSKSVRPNNASLSKTACPSKVYSSKPVCPSNICPSKPVCLSNISLSKPACATSVFPSKLVHSINVCPSKPVCASNVYSSKPVSPSNDYQSKPVVL